MTSKTLVQLLAEIPGRSSVNESLDQFYLSRDLNSDLDCTLLILQADMDERIIGLKAGKRLKIRTLLPEFIKLPEPTISLEDSFI